MHSGALKDRAPEIRAEGLLLAVLVLRAVCCRHGMHGSHLQTSAEVALFVTRSPGRLPHDTGENCTLLVCPPAGRRRRQLLGGACFDATCPFNQTTGKADCDLIDQVAQLTSYSINSTAVKSDGVRTSKTGPPQAFSVPLYP